jgi:hypothetical protein
MSEHQYINKRREDKKRSHMRSSCPRTRGAHVKTNDAMDRKVLLHTIKRAQKIAVIDPSTSEALVILQNGTKKNCG